jgi:electron transport complex protein RnfA
MALCFFAALSLNLLLCFGLGTKEMISREREPALYNYYPWGILFLVTAVLALFFLNIPFLRLFEFVLIVPLSIVSGMGAEYLLFAFVLRGRESPRIFKIGSGYSALLPAALYLTVHFAVTSAEALLIAFALSAGGFLAFLCIKEIQKRSFLESIPYGLRGAPILLISMGLLSLILSSGAVLLLRILQ